MYDLVLLHGSLLTIFIIFHALLKSMVDSGMYVCTYSVSQS